MPANDLPIVCALGDSAVLVEFGDKIDPLINQQVYSLDAWLKADTLAGVLEFIPAYTSLVIQYDPSRLNFSEVLAWLNQKVRSCPKENNSSQKLIEVPVVYGGKAGVDLSAVAAAHQLSDEEAIQIHSQNEYTVAMMGFTPGFAYLSGMDPRLSTPRLSSPRTQVPAGSVGIAGVQTGIYSIESPGGWQLIGRTALTLFDPLNQEPFLFSPGDKVRFIPISPAEAETDA